MSTSYRDTPQFGSNKPGTPGDPSQCAECETMLADALDGTLTAEDHQRFDSHMLSCTACAGMFADAQRGAAWLELLRDPRPEPPALLVERILHRTQAETVQPLSLVPTAQPMPVAGLSSTGMPLLPPGNLYPFPTRSKSILQSLHHTLLQPRLAMTAAMAFFSIGLTLNLTGVQLNQLNTRELKPANIRRSFYQANASVIRYYDNLRVVYELESRVHELQRTGYEENPSAEPAVPTAKPTETEPDQPQKRPSPHPGSGSSRQQIQPEPQTLAALHRDSQTSAPSQKGVPA